MYCLQSKCHLRDKACIINKKTKFFVDSCCLQDLEKEYQRQAFFQSKVADGEITAVKFAEIMKTLRGHKLSPFVRNYLLTVREEIEFSGVI